MNYASETAGRPWQIQHPVSLPSSRHHILTRLTILTYTTWNCGFWDILQIPIRIKLFADLPCVHTFNSTANSPSHPVALECSTTRWPALSTEGAVSGIAGSRRWSVAILRI